MRRNYGGYSYNFNIAWPLDILSYDGILGIWYGLSNGKRDNLEEHNDWDNTNWEDTLNSATQCGDVTPVRALTRFVKQDLCTPAGNTGGN